MSLMKDTEGAEIPFDDVWGRLFDLDLITQPNDDPEIMLLLNIPPYFETEFGVYNSFGVLEVDLRDVLAEVIQRGDANEKLARALIECGEMILKQYNQQL